MTFTIEDFSAGYYGVPESFDGYREPDVITDVREAAVLGMKKYASLLHFRKEHPKRQYDRKPIDAIFDDTCLLEMFYEQGVAAWKRRILTNANHLS